MNDLDKFFAASTKAVNIRIESLIAEAAIASKRLDSAVRWSAFGSGKRFRPTLVFAVGEVLGVTRERLVNMAAAVEMIHTYSLIHDDLPAMDDDDLRRGRETCHKKFDEATAILAGDALHVLAFEAVANDAGLKIEIRLSLLSGLAAAARKMVVGQQLDLDAEGIDIPVARIKDIHSNKTGALITFSAQSAAIISEASQTNYEAVSNFAARLGLLFQMSDDILDVTQSTATLGKTAAKDISAKKATYPGALGIDASKKLLHEVYESALAALEPLERRFDLLAQLAKYVVERKS